MAEPLVKDANAKRCDDERTELYRIRDAAWESQKANGRTGTCEFLRLLLDVYREINVLDGVEKEAKKPAHEHTPVGFGATHHETPAKGGKKTV